MPYIGNTSQKFVTADDVTVTDDLTVTDDATIGGDLAVTGTTTSTGSISTSNDLTISAGGTLDVFNSGNTSTDLTALLGADNGGGHGRTNSTNKTTVIGMPHYTNAQEPVGLIVAGSLSGENFIEIGGGGSVINAATSVSIRTASDTTTTGGTKQLTVNSSGDIDVETGDIFFSTAGKGIVLGATSNTAANTLDDYEEGTWTPVITTSGAPNTAFTQYNDGAFYTKVGNTVFLFGQFRTNGVTIAGASGNVVVNGLPFAAYSTPSGGININSSDGWTASPHAGYVSSSSLQLTYQLLSSSQNIVNLPYTALATGSGLKNLIHIFGTYRTDS